MAGKGMLETLYIVAGFDFTRTWLVGVFRSIAEADTALEKASEGYKERNPEKPDPVFYTTNIEVGKDYQEHQIQVQLN